jgi:glutathione synthase/RimK-type ligase-like ATP-grasp enzyme
MMILIITHKEDFTADFVINKLNDRGIQYYRLNCEDIDKDNYVFENSNDFIFSINNNCSFHSIWFRRTKLPDIDVKNEAEKLYLLGDYDSLFENMYDLISAKKWLSHPNYVYQAENKIHQLAIARDIGFNIPDTIVTNDQSILRKFIDKNNGNIIVKPIRQGRIRQKSGYKSIFTNKVNSDIINDLENYHLTPCIFQENINKEYELRVTIVGNKVFSAKVDSQKVEETKIDWRKKKTFFQQYELPEEVSRKCLAITKNLNLSFGAIDLIKNECGEYVFLEINPNGQWAWLEMEAGLKISDEIINFLIE